jgi:hypothetical protein
MVAAAGYPVVGLMRILVLRVLRRNVCGLQHRRRDHNRKAGKMQGGGHSNDRKQLARGKPPDAGVTAAARPSSP